MGGPWGPLGEYDRRLGGESNREIVFVSFVRACERSCVCPRDDVASEAGLRKVRKCSGAWRVACVPLAVSIRFDMSPIIQMLMLKIDANRV